MAHFFSYTSCQEGSGDTNARTGTAGRASSSGAQAVTWRAGRGPGGERPLSVECPPRSGVSAAYRRPQDGAGGGLDDDDAVGLIRRAAAAADAPDCPPALLAASADMDALSVAEEAGLVRLESGRVGHSPS
ncbi:hypothetical protein JCM4814A_00390 [Streptomyces phaeofaciens JCM 4814]|uniref:Uncharacterized protein n=1 Tax=Streptomyces phaeofaciens TaxID=68254 RepID=A0A918HQS0_9ACTN|nr:hypothetical protein GCM10010226_87950 [Streptomyces phaeofaciens]